MATTKKKPMKHNLTKSLLGLVLLAVSTLLATPASVRANDMKKTTKTSKTTASLKVKDLKPRKDVRGLGTKTKGKPKPGRMSVEHYFDATSVSY